MEHRLTGQDQWFVEMRRRDPLTGSEFGIGDRVVVCNKCRCVQTIDSWRFNDNKCVQCDNSAYANEFSRSFVDVSYHREYDGAHKKLKGFKIVESDVKYKIDAIIKFFSERNLKTIWIWFIVISLILIATMIGLCVYYGASEPMDYATPHYADFTNISVKISNLSKKIAAIRSFQGITEKIAAIRSFQGIIEKINISVFKLDRIMGKMSILSEKAILLGTSFGLLLNKVFMAPGKIPLSDKTTKALGNIRRFITYVTEVTRR